MTTHPVPRFDQLPRPAGEDLPLAWGVWGPKDQIGTLNNITPERVAAAARLVRRGERFNLNLPLHMPLGVVEQGAHRLRQAPDQTLFKSSYAGFSVRDDKLDNFYLQASTQWDGLTHVGDAAHGFYNGVRDEEVTQREGTRNGIEHFVAHGIAGRGVVVDLPRHFARRGRAWDAVGSHAASVEDVIACIEDQRTELRPGDILLVRTGWIAAFRTAASEAARDRLFRARDYSGLSGDAKMWAFLWDRGVAAVASDTVTVEAWPLSEGKPSLHLAIARLGLVLGEMFDLDALAEACAADGDWQCFFVSVPLNLRGGVGSPANAMALR